MNPFLLSTDDRLAYWKNFRKSLHDLSDTDKTIAVADYWSQAPLISMAYDCTDASHWPSPWEMIRDNIWCRKSVAIGMENTLRLAGMSPDRLVLELMIDRNIEDELLVLVVDGLVVLNYDWGEIRIHPKTNFRILKKWRFNGKTYSLLDG
jgi:hypothetical protein